MRCFVAIELPMEIRHRLAVLQENLNPLKRTVRWVQPEHIHLTVKFLGEVADGDLSAVSEAVRAVASRFAPLEVELAGTGCFPPGGPARIVWAGVAGPPPALVECQRGCEEALAPLGFPPEQRAYRPHLTLGRVRNARASGEIRPAVKQQESFVVGRFVATDLVLFQSILKPSGPTYVVLARFPFGC